MTYKRITRRDVLKTGMAAWAVPTVIMRRGSALAGPRQTSPTNRIVMGAIGVGPRCTHLLEHFMLFDDVQIVAVSDCRRDRLEAAKAQVDKHYGNSDCQTYADFRELLAREDIEAVIVATGDRWHANHHRV